MVSWGKMMAMRPPPTQYATEDNLAARQRLWAISRYEPAFSLYSWVLGLAGLQGGEAILEVGCGNGAYLELVESVGLDVSLGMLAAARKRARGPLVAGDVVRLPLATSSFDVVLAAHMLYHVEDRATAALEIRRVLRPRGVFVAVTNGESNHQEMVDLVEDVVGRGWRWSRPSDVGFSLENGAGQLRIAFDHVDRVDCPGVVVTVTDADALADYLASVGDHYASQVDGWTTWGDVVAECRQRVARVIQSEGGFQISGSMGAFVCR